jgi:hypothetical protein
VRLSLTPGVLVGVAALWVLAFASVPAGTAQPPPAQTVPFPGTAIVPPGGTVTFERPAPSPFRFTLVVRVTNLSPVEATVTYTGPALTISVAPGHIVQVLGLGVERFHQCMSEAGAASTMVCAWVPAEPPTSLSFTAVTRVPTEPLEAALEMVEPPPCIPPPDELRCDAERAALWDGDADAWAARGVSDGDAVLQETIVLRAEAGDPLTIGAIARAIEAPYLKVTRLRFGGVEPGQVDEFVEIANLGGGTQAETTWEVRSVERGRAGTILARALAPGERCRLYSGQAAEEPCAAGSLGAFDLWPDEAGTIEIRLIPTGVLVDRTRYSADPLDQPPPPSLQLVTAPE